MSTPVAWYMATLTRQIVHVHVNVTLASGHRRVSDMGGIAHT